MIKGFLYELWNFIQISAPYLLFGFGVSGLIHRFINIDLMKKKLKSAKSTDVIWASLVGVPLPLCSCSVVPTAATIKKSGASNGATSSFLISTPESGVDSIFMTYAVLDLPMTIIRPILAFVTALIAGVLNNTFNKFEFIEEKKAKTSCCSHKDTKNQISIVSSLRYGFVDLLDDMVGWLTLGLLLGALIGTLVPEDFFHHFNSHTNRLLILFIGIPTYICASASTPIAASLILKGLSPGAALLFLMVGPATNISNIAIIQKYIGKKGVIINILTITIVSLIASYAVDYAYEYLWTLDIKFSFTHEHTSESNILEKVATPVFLTLLASSLYRTYLKPNKHTHTH